MYAQKMMPDKNGKIGDGVKFERIRRITGYLVGTLDRFNNGKKAECEDRVKHMKLQQKKIDTGYYKKVKGVLICTPIWHLICV